MAHITTGVEYALHCLVYLVEPLGEERVASVRDLADLQGIPVEYVAKLFTKLQKAGLVTASEGARGGFKLAKPAKSIAVLDVVVAIDGEKPLFECREIRAKCAVFDGKPATWATRGVCVIHAIMLDAEARMRKALSSRTLSDIVGQLDAKAPAAYRQKVADWLELRSS
jgi:Rrf2 family protein